jgi:hypothetical protein
LSRLAEIPAGSSAHCRNCNFFLGAVPGKYCPNCGQDTAAHPPSALEFLHEFVGHYVALEGALARTLGLLIFRPGELTLRYFAGKKNSYVLPLRLYLSASIVFFLVVKIFGAGNLAKGAVEPEATRSATATVAAPDAFKPKIHVVKPGLINIDADDAGAMTTQFVSIIKCDFAPVQCAKLTTYLKGKYHEQSVAEVGRHVKERMISLAPYAMFAFLPVFALITQLLYRKRRLQYGEHLVYAFHVHAFAFLLLLTIALANAAIGDLLYFVGAVYFWLAMRRVFGGRWWATALRFAAISTLYLALLPLVLGIVLLTAVFI